ncbi:hypothetical protein [Caenispirillum bisanense]|uniref:Uncharacterized protein n=1 Tax=Caenispirillum bisanense TaxID=414052 RepID=A0A286GUI0_9PROT|nr:hypothetical protein [Caenispirillum bisanense]SOD99227.1 hypothetical protein SAMN05421508_108262 [Caenispirillum bisanense]
MSTVIPFPAKPLASAFDVIEDDQIHAIRAMLRYLHREASESGLGGTAARISDALDALDAEQPA